MLVSVWDMRETEKMHANILETYKGIDIYTLATESQSVCVMVNGALLRVGFSHSALNGLKNLIDKGSDIPTAIKDYVIANLPGYALNECSLNLQYANAVGLSKEAGIARSQREAIQAKVEAEEDAKAELEALEAKQAQDVTLLAMAEKFTNGGLVDADIFIKLLQKYSIWSSIPIKTKGWINKNLDSASLTACYGKTKSKNIYPIIRQLAVSISAVNVA